jgi:hypothetical protein
MLININNIDKILEFDEPTHKYNVDDIELISVTTFFSKYCEKFNSDLIISSITKNKNSIYFNRNKEDIEKEWKDTAILGTKMHLNIENFINGLQINDNKINDNKINDNKINEDNDTIDIYKELIYFHNFFKNLKYKKLYPEFRVFDIDYKIAGTIDLLVENDTENYDIVDWKRSKNISYKSWKKMKNPLHNIPDTNFYKYSFQLNIYKFILERNYNIKIRNMYLIILYHTNEDYIKIDIPEFDQEIKILFGS